MIVVFPDHTHLLFGVQMGGWVGSIILQIEDANEKVDLDTVKPVLRGHSKIDKTKILKTNGSLMKVKSIAECFLGALCNTFDLH